MKQIIGHRKHNLCQEIAGKKYLVCYMTRQHNIAQCWIDNRNADYVNYKVKHCWPAIRDGQYVK